MTFLKNTNWMTSTPAKAFTAMQWTLDHSQYLQQESFRCLLDLKSKEEVDIASAFSPFPILPEIVYPRHNKPQKKVRIRNPCLPNTVIEFENDTETGTETEDEVKAESKAESETESEAEDGVAVRKRKRLIVEESEDEEEILEPKPAASEASGKPVVKDMQVYYTTLTTGDMAYFVYVDRERDKIHWLYSREDLKDLTVSCGHCKCCANCAVRAKGEKEMLPGTYVYSNHEDIHTGSKPGKPGHLVKIVGFLNLEDRELHLYESYRQAVDLARMILARGSGITANAWLYRLWTSDQEATIKDSHRQCQEQRAWLANCQDSAPIATKTSTATQPSS